MKHGATQATRRDLPPRIAECGDGNDCYLGVSSYGEFEKKGDGNCTCETLVIPPWSTQISFRNGSLEHFSKVKKLTIHRLYFDLPPGSLVGLKSLESLDVFLQGIQPFGHQYNYIGTDRTECVVKGGTIHNGVFTGLPALKMLNITVSPIPFGPPFGELSARWPSSMFVGRPSDYELLREADPMIRHFMESHVSREAFHSSQPIFDVPWSWCNVIADDAFYYDAFNNATDRIEPIEVSTASGVFDLPALEYLRIDGRLLDPPCLLPSSFL